MNKVIAGMTISLDGFVADENGSVERLYPALEALQGTGFMQRIVDETGAVVMGRRSFEMAPDPDWYVGNYEFQVPIFVVSHLPPERQPKQDERLSFTFVTDGVESAIRQARSATGKKAVQIIGGPNIIAQALSAGLVNELSLDVMPVFLGRGLRLFDDPDLTGLELGKASVEEVGERTSFRFRVKNAAG